jgi:hypothetical protein
VFRTTPEFAEASKKLAANQGLYNGFLAAGLVWGLCLGAAGLEVKIFFLACVIIAGVFGAVTVNRYILFIQALPGILALALLLAVAFRRMGNRLSKIATRTGDRARPASATAAAWRRTRRASRRWATSTS